MPVVVGVSDRGHCDLRVETVVLFVRNKAEMTAPAYYDDGPAAETDSWSVIVKAKQAGLGTLRCILARTPKIAADGTDCAGHTLDVNNGVFWDKSLR